MGGRGREKKKKILFIILFILCYLNFFQQEFSFIFIESGGGKLASFEYLTLGGTTRFNTINIIEAIVFDTMKSNNKYENVL